MSLLFAIFPSAVSCFWQYHTSHLASAPQSHIEVIKHQMAPFQSVASSLLFKKQANASANSGPTGGVTAFLSAQWTNPGDILSVLLLLGPEIVQRAVAQLAGRAVTPVAFSFGWVAYAASALLSTFGGNVFGFLFHCAAFPRLRS